MRTRPNGLNDRTPQRIKEQHRKAKLWKNVLLTPFYLFGGYCAIYVILSNPLIFIFGLIIAVLWLMGGKH